jgi:hypothetical protein
VLTEEKFIEISAGLERYSRKTIIYLAEETRVSKS